MKVRDLKKIERIGNEKNIKNFVISYDRHAGRYTSPVGPRFPESYPYETALYDMKNDPDWTVKYQDQRVRLLPILLSLFTVATLVHWRFQSVSTYDVYKR